MKENVSDQNQPQSYWIRLYNSLGLWLSIYLIIIASGFYIIKVEFAPNQQMNPPSENLPKSFTNPTNESIKMNKQNDIDRSQTMIADDKGMQNIDEK